VTRLVVMLGSLILLATSPVSFGSQLPLRAPSPCVVDSLAQRTLRFARNLMTSRNGVATRADYRLPRLPPAQVAIVTSPSVCAQAVEAYRRRGGTAAPLAPPTPRLAVVRAGTYFFVEDVDAEAKTRAEVESDVPYWEVIIYDRHWRQLASMGGGT
jgi:hypothetical protein